MIYENGLSNYILLSDNIEVGDKLYFGTSLIINKENSCLKIGSSVPLSYVSLFSLINNIELRAFNGGQLARAAGTSGILISKSANLITVKLKSG
jgi:large subunit ribosomal protein L2